MQEVNTPAFLCNHVRDDGVCESGADGHAAAENGVQCRQPDPLEWYGSVEIADELHIAVFNQECHTHKAQ